MCLWQCFPHVMDYLMSHLFKSKGPRKDGPALFYLNFASKRMINGAAREKWREITNSKKKKRIFCFSQIIIVMSADFAKSLSAHHQIVHCPIIIVCSYNFWFHTNWAWIGASQCFQHRMKPISQSQFVKIETIIMVFNAKGTSFFPK